MGVTVVEREILHLKAQHRETWRDRSEWFWMRGLLEEVWELALALMGLHKDSPDWELTQISAIAANWLEMRQERRDGLGSL